MKRPVRKILALTLAVAMIAILSGSLWPRHYKALSMQAVDGMQYRSLSTGSTIAYIMLGGRGQKKPYPVIFLQGGPGGFITNRTIALFRPLTADGYDVYLYDQTGSGHSARLTNIREYTAARHRQDLEALVQSIGARKSSLSASPGAPFSPRYLLP